MVFREVTEAIWECRLFGDEYRNMTYQLPPIESIWDAENSFYLQSPPSRLAKLLCHYELFKMISGIPGAIIECGVYKGASLMRFAQFRSYLENDDSRKIVGFDAFGEFPKENLSLANDVRLIDKFEGDGGFGISKEDLESCLAKKSITNVFLHEGNVFDTVPKFLDENPQCKISLLHLDMDVYEPTKRCFELLFKRMVKGGLIVVDDYNAVEGATRATDEFIAKENLSVEKLPFYNIPSFIRV